MVVGPLGGGNDGIGRRTEDDPNLVIAQCHGSNVGPMGALRKGDGGLTSGVPFVTHPLKAEGADASEDGKGRGVPMVAFSTNQRGEGRMREVHGSLTAERSAKQVDGILAQGVRRLTPVECERLQGFPEVETCAIIELCLDHRKSDADAGPRNLRLPKSVSPADERESRGDAPYVELSSLTAHPSSGKPAPADVHIVCELDVIEIRSQRKLLLSVQRAEHPSSSPLPIGTDDFVQLLAGFVSTAARIIGVGREALHLSERCSIHRLNGKLYVVLSGRGIMQLANDVVAGSIILSKHMKSTIASRLNINGSALELATSFFSAFAAISGFIPKEILQSNSLTIEVATRRGWTCLCDEIPCRCPDSPRYRTLGNAVTVNVAEFIGRQLMRHLQGERMGVRR